MCFARVNAILFSWSKVKVEGLIEREGLAFTLAMGFGRVARPVERVDSARCALDARDSRHWARHATVHNAFRSLITSPGRPPSLSPAHGNITHNIHVFATSVSDVPSLLTKDHILNIRRCQTLRNGHSSDGKREHCTWFLAHLCTAAEGGGRAVALTT